MRRLTARIAPGPRDERGSLIIALTIILILVVITAAVAVRVIGNETIVLTHQGTASAVSGADGGISDALFQLDQGTQTQTFCVSSDPAYPLCTAPAAGSTPGAPGVTYVATAAGPTKWTIDAIDTVQGHQAAVQETVTRTSKYPFALFGNTSLTFNGNATGSFSTYDDTQAASGSNPNNTANVAIGSNGAITCDGGIGTNVQTNYYGSSSVSNLQNGSCGSPQAFSNDYYLPTPVAPKFTLPCPNNGQLGSGIAGAPTSIGPGTYLCTTPVTISGLLQITGQVSLYIILSNSTYNSNTSALTIAAKSYVNDMSDYCASAGSSTPGCTPTPDLPAAANFQVLIDSDGQVGFDNGQGYDFGGVLYAPNSYLTQDGCKSQYYGSLVINTLTCNGGPHLYVAYDSELGQVYGPWTPSAYTQVNPATLTPLLAPFK
jgi:hypothetical protein